MNIQNAKALIVGFYLSKYDKAAYKNLNLGNSTETHSRIGKILNVNPNSIKNMRDEFDPYHSNRRAGWYQRPLRPSRLKVYNSFMDLTELALRQVVLDIINKNHDYSLEPIVENISNSNEVEDNSDDVTYASRGITGEKAEKYFRDNWQVHYPDYFNLENRTKDGCGYDYKLIRNNKIERYIEVKGMKDISGGILLTSKEWDVALEKNSDYDLFIVSNINDNASVKIITNPVEKLLPKKQIQTIVQVNWTLTSKQIKDA